MRAQQRCRKTATAPGRLAQVSDDTTCNIACSPRLSDWQYVATVNPHMGMTQVGQRACGSTQPGDGKQQCCDEGHGACSTAASAAGPAGVLTHSSKRSAADCWGCLSSGTLTMDLVAGERICVQTRLSSPEHPSSGHACGGSGSATWLCTHARLQNHGLDVTRTGAAGHPGRWGTRARVSGQEGLCSGDGTEAVLAEWRHRCVLTLFTL